MAGRSSKIAPEYDGSASESKFSQTIRREAPLWFGLALVGIILGGLLVGYEPVGGDPDRLYRPMKSELARALREGRLPFWSSRFGLGLPLIAESHVAAFYPPNLLLYRVFDVSTAYRLSMWLHYMALVATTYFYGRCLGLSGWGSALSGVSFALCGFQMNHASHEPLYSLLPYLPLALLLTERYLTNGRAVWLALIALCLGLQWTLGHFQLQMWTGGLVIASALWRAGLNRSYGGRALAVIAATALGAAIAAVQLGLSWQFAAAVQQTDRPVSSLSYYSFPPAHWFELVLPRLIRELRLGPEDPYWHGEQTWGYEAALYVGTIPLVFAFIAILGRPASRQALLWRVLAVLGIALATMPRWWPQGYFWLLTLPGLGYFRVPARYTLLTSLGLSLPAGEGFDKAVAKRRFRLGLATALVFAGCATVAAILWTRRPDVHLVSSWGGMTGGFLWGGLAWLVAVAAVLAWRARHLPSWVPVAVAGIELGLLFYTGSTQWGWAVSVPGQSPVFKELLARSPTGLVGGEMHDLPLRAGLATAYPYIGVAHRYPNNLLLLVQYRLRDPRAIVTRNGEEANFATRWLRRFRVEYIVSPRPALIALGTEVGRWQDPALERLFPPDPTDPPDRLWSLIKLDDPAQEVRVARRAETVLRHPDLIARLDAREEPDLALFLSEDTVPPRPDARSARLVSWDGSTATVEHDGTCDLVIVRSFEEGWLARIDDGPAQGVVPVNGGLQAVRIAGSGTHRVSLRYHPPRLMLYAAIALAAIALDAGIILSSLAAWAVSRWRSHVASLVTG